MKTHFIENNNIIIMYLPDSMRFFKINYNTKNVIKAMVESMPCEIVLNKFNIKEKRNNGKDYGFTSMNLVIEGLKKKIVRTHYCEAGISRFAVSTSGNVFPCWIFSDQTEFCLGNVLDDNFFENEKFISLTKRLLEYNRFKNKRCLNCFNRTLCRKCIGKNFFETGDLQNVPTQECDFSKKMAEKIIFELSK